MRTPTPTIMASTKLYITLLWEFDPQKHLLLPHMPVGINSYIVSKPNTSGRTRKIARWEVIKEALKKLQRVCNGNVEFDLGDELRKCVEAYNDELDGNWGVLNDMIGLAIQRWGKVQVYGVISFMVDACLDVEKFSRHIPLLTGNVPGKEVVQLSKAEILCLLANGFFCCYPERSGKGSTFSEFPLVNFNRLFDDSDQKKRGWGWDSWRSKMKQAKVHKLLCILSYFRRMKDRMGAGGGGGDQCSSLPILFERYTLGLDETPVWGPSLMSGFCNLKVMNSGSIDDDIGQGLAVDFANKMVGGGTLGNGAAMEEILFSCCPELIASLLFTRELRDNECLIVEGFEKFSKGKGYAESFIFDGDFVQKDCVGNRVAALDAFKFKKDSLLTQLDKQWIDRELNKCFVGFQCEKWKVRTGKWGCGVFNGDKYLKCIIQYIACSVACVPYLEIYTFGDTELGNALCELDSVVQRRDICVGRVYQCLLDFGKLRKVGMSGESLFKYLINELSDGRAAHHPAEDNLGWPSRIWKLISPVLLGLVIVGIVASKVVEMG